MTFPSILLGIVIGATIGCAFHFWRGGGFKWMMLYILLGIVGFWAGHFIAEIGGWHFLPLGPINFGGSLVGSIVLLFSGSWLSMASVEFTKK